VGRERTPTTIQNGRFSPVTFFFCFKNFFFSIFSSSLWGEKNQNGGREERQELGGSSFPRERHTQKTYNKRLERKKKEKTQLKGRLA
jgi:hypothetical protein